MELDIKKLSQRLDKVIQAFNEKGCLSTADMTNALNTKNRNTVKEIIQQLEARGYSIKQEKRNRSNYYSIAQAPIEETFTQYQPITKETLREYSITSALSSRPIEQSDFSELFTIKDNAEKAIQTDLTNKIPLDIKQTTFYKTLNKLQSQGIIILKDNRYYLNKGELFTPSLSIDESSCFQLEYELSNITKGNPYYKELKNVYRKLCLILGEISSELPFYENYLVYGKRISGLSGVSDRISDIFARDYKNKVLNITHLNRKGRTVNTLIAIGLMVYCVEKDIFYIMGYQYEQSSNNAQHRIAIIDISTIKNIMETDIIHNSYNAPEFNNLYKTMFSISVDEPVKVKVEFDLVANVERKIRYLALQRPGSEVIRVDDDKLIYTDTISGIADFATYLRQFGRSARVLEPQALAEKMEFSVNRSLERYTEVMGNE